MFLRILVCKVCITPSAFRSPSLNQALAVVCGARAQRGTWDPSAEWRWSGHWPLCRLLHLLFLHCPGFLIWAHQVCKRVSLFSNCRFYRNKMSTVSEETSVCRSPGLFCIPGSCTKPDFWILPVDHSQQNVRTPLDCVLFCDTVSWLLAVPLEPGRLGRVPALLLISCATLARWPCL